MYTLHINDEQVYQRLTRKMEHEQRTLDEVLRDLLAEDEPVHEPTVEADSSTAETPGQKLVRLLAEPEAQAIFGGPQPFTAREAEDILRNEMGMIDWRLPNEHETDLNLDED